MTRNKLILLTLLFAACKPEAPAEPSPTPPTPTVLTTPQTTSTPKLEDHPWRSHIHKLNVEGTPRTFTLKDGKASLPGPGPHQTWALYMHEISYGDLTEDGQQDAALGLSLHLRTDLPGKAPKHEKSQIITRLYTGSNKDGKPHLATTWSQAGSALSWVDINEDVELTLGIVTRPDAKYNAVEEVVMVWEKDALKVIRRQKSYSD